MSHSDIRDLGNFDEQVTPFLSPSQFIRVIIVEVDTHHTISSKDTSAMCESLFHYSDGDSCEFFSLAPCKSYYSQIDQYFLHYTKELLN